METILDRHIVINPNICHGRPHIQGHRIRVQDIAIWHEKLGMRADDICAEYNLTLAEVYAALAYYFDYKESVDEAIETDEAFVEAFKKNNPSKLL